MKKNEFAYEQKGVYDSDYKNKKDEIFAFARDYKEFLNNSKTERLSVDNAVKIAVSHGFVPLGDKTGSNAGDKVYAVNRNKSVIFAVIGRESMDRGVNIIAWHVDVPRLDLKANPLYEDMSLAMLKTHYYGGIKKYQWTAVPLALYGVVYKKDGGAVNISIGDSDDECVFTVTDLLPHLAGEQMKKTMSEGIEGEGLNLLFGSIPCGDEEIKERVKSNILTLLNQKYGICERDFISAEISAVPAIAARDVGFDGSMIGAYGQDDRVCAYTSLRAICETEAPAKTAVCALVDKEEVGSAGNTGMKSRYFENFITDLCEKTGANIRACLSNSVCLSADVGAACDPNYPSVFEKRNTAAIGGGVLLMKYTGSRGKSGSSDASAELLIKIIRLFDSKRIPWQTGELGKVDAGGGGTIAQYIANLDVETLDCGVPILSMHSPFEIASKADIYVAYEAYKAFILQP